jgi:peptidoglycan hydrolase-like protein with peptidoglycan-binding domain
VTAPLASATIPGLPNTGFSPSSDQSVRMIAIDLTIGDNGNNVGILQQFLISQNAGSAARALEQVGATGYFGVLTQEALAEFQASAGISPTQGFFGPITRAYLQTQAFP